MPSQLGLGTCYLRLATKQNTCHLLGAGLLGLHRLFMTPGGICSDAMSHLTALSCAPREGDVIARIRKCLALVAPQPGVPVLACCLPMLPAVQSDFDAPTLPCHIDGRHLECLVRGVHTGCIPHSTNSCKSSASCSLSGLWGMVQALQYPARWSFTGLHLSQHVARAIIPIDTKHVPPTAGSTYVNDSFANT